MLGGRINTPEILVKFAFASCDVELASFNEELVSCHEEFASCHEEFSCGHSGRMEDPLSLSHLKKRRWRDNNYYQVRKSLVYCVWPVFMRGRDSSETLSQIIPDPHVNNAQLSFDHIHVHSTNLNGDNGRYLFNISGFF